MPRLQPPKGYITLREAENLLNLSSAMIRRYVEKGRIGYLLPPGRRHGFYRRSDVVKLATELNAFLTNLEDEEESIVRNAQLEDLPACITLNKQIFPNVQSPADDATLLKKWGQWLEKNPEIIHILDRGGEIIGIVTALPFPAESPRLWDALRGDISFIRGDVDISAEDLAEFFPGKPLDLYLMEIGVSPSLPSSLRHKYGARLIARFASFIVELGQRGVQIQRMVAVGGSRAGVRLLQHFGFHEVLFEREDTRLFILEIEESGAPIVDNYREALREWQKHSA